HPTLCLFSAGRSANPSLDCYPTRRSSDLDAVLDLDGVAHVGPVGQDGARAQARERPDAHRALGPYALQVAVRTHLGAVGQPDVPESAERADAHAVAQFHPALEPHVHVDLDIAAHDDLAAEVDPRRVGEAHALRAQRAHLAQLEGALE